MARGSRTTGLAIAALLWGGGVTPARAGLQGMHPTGQTWVDQHGGLAEHDTSACKPCHGSDLHGSPASRTFADRDLDADDFGRKFFWQGFQVGCYTCHLGPDSERRNPNRPAHVEDLSLSTIADAALTRALTADDPEGDDLELRIVTYPAHGTAQIDGALLTYHPGAGFAGEDELTYAAWDGATDSNLGRVFVTVSTAVPTPTDLPATATPRLPKPSPTLPGPTVARATATPTGLPQAASPSPTRTRTAASCMGDCDGSGSVEVSELVVAVRIAVEGESPERCAAADGNADDVVSVNELVLSVSSALEGCGVGSTPTVARTRIPTPTRTPAVPTRTRTVAKTAPPTASPPPTSTPTHTPPATPTATVAAPSFDSVLQSFSSAGCTFCHAGSNPAGSLNLAGSGAYDALVGVDPANGSARAAGLQLVVPGDAQRSFLLIKVTSPGPGQGSLMNGLSSAQVQTLRSWISAGAAR